MNLNVSYALAATVFAAVPLLANTLNQSPPTPPPPRPAVHAAFVSNPPSTTPSPKAKAPAKSPPTPSPVPARPAAAVRLNPSPAPSRVMVLGYYVPGIAAWNDLTAHAGQITAVAPFWYSIRTNGTLNTLSSDTDTLMTWAVRNHIAVYPMVINGYGNDIALLNSGVMQANVNRLLTLARADGYAGFNVDFESLNNPDEAGLDQFVADLAAGLHRMGKKLIVSVGPRTGNQNGYHVYNYAYLGSVADFVDLMTYDDHDSGGSPGPVAPMGWVNRIVQYADATIPPSKILMGLAGYGYNWSSAGSTEISDAQALALARRYGSQWVAGTTQESTIQYTDANGSSHTVWFEDSRSEAAKAALVGQDHLGGVALWDLGEEDAGTWPMLAHELP